MSTSVPDLQLSQNIMWRNTCILEVQKSDNDKNNASCSGIIINPHKGLVISHGSLLWPLLDQEHKSRLLTECQLQKHDLSSYPIKIILDSGLDVLKKGKFKKDLENRKIYGDSGHFLSPNKCDAPGKESHQIAQCSGKILCIWKSTSFAKILDRMMPRTDGWKFSDDGNIGSTDSGSTHKKKSEENTEQMDSNDSFMALPFFLLIEMDDNFKSGGNYLPALIASGAVRQGERVSIVGTPFGSLSPAVFMNSVSDGVLSNVVGNKGEMLLTDARAIPGTEGGAIFGKNGDILGMLVASLCWKSNEWIGLAIGCSIHCILSSLPESEHLLPSRIIDVLHSIASEKFTSVTLGGTAAPVAYSPHQVVLVRCGGSWGTGVVVDARQGVLLTCSHVVRASHGRKVTVVKTFPRRRSVSARVIFSCPPGEVYDMAVLKLDDPGTEQQEPRLVVRPSQQGETAYAVGHACFSEHAGLQPSVTKGAVSKVIHNKSQPVMIQSTCAVHAGASGGPLVGQDGAVIGLLTCNAKDVVSGSSYPHVNMSIPMATIWPIISTYLETNDTAVLHKLCIQENRVKALWNLKDELSHLHSKL